MLFRLIASELLALVGFTGVTTLAGIAFWLRASKVVTPAVAELPVVRALSENTYPLMLHHRLFYFLVSLSMGLIGLVTPLNHTFDWSHLMTDGHYYFMPFGIGQFALLYLLAGVAGPLAIHRVWRRLRGGVPSRA